MDQTLAMFHSHFAKALKVNKFITICAEKQKADFSVFQKLYEILKRWKIRLALTHAYLYLLSTKRYK